MYQFEYHVNRLASSSAFMIAEGVSPEGCSELDPAVYDAVTNVDKVRAETLSSIEKTVAEFRNQYNDRMYPCDEFRITLLQTWLPEKNESLRVMTTMKKRRQSGDVPWWNWQREYVLSRWHPPQA